MIKFLFTSFAKNQRGTAAIEFALVAPIMLIISLGMFELAGYSNANIKFTNATQLLGELVAEQTSLSSSQATNFCTGAKYALSPLNTASFTATIASVTNTGGTDAVDWQDTSCGGVSISNAVALAASLIPNSGDSAIIISANYTYASPLTYILSSSYSLTQTAFTRPRNIATIPHG
jgi:Flp pilus assembly protein TadG